MSPGLFWGHDVPEDIFPLTTDCAVAGFCVALRGDVGKEGDHLYISAGGQKKEKSDHDWRSGAGGRGLRP